MMFSVRLLPGSAARCKGNGKQGSAGAALGSALGAMDSKGGRNRGQKARPRPKANSAAMEDVLHGAPRNAMDFGTERNQASENGLRRYRG